MIKCRSLGSGVTSWAHLMRWCNKLLKAQTNPGEFMNFVKWKDNVHETTFSFSSCFPQSFLLLFFFGEVARKFLFFWCGCLKIRKEKRPCSFFVLPPRIWERLHAGDVQLSDTIRHWISLDFVSSLQLSEDFLPYLRGRNISLFRAHFRKIFMISDTPPQFARSLTKNEGK